MKKFAVCGDGLDMRNATRVMKTTIRLQEYENIPYSNLNTLTTMPV